MSETQKCERCDGRGSFTAANPPAEYPCSACGGNGATPSSRPVAGESIGSLVEAAFSEPVTPMTPADLRAWCEQERTALVEYETQFSDPAWTFLHQMEDLATRLDGIDAMRGAVYDAAAEHDRALAPLRAAVKGCKRVFASAPPCGYRFYDDEPLLCPSCERKLWSAISALLGGSNG